MAAPSLLLLILALPLAQEQDRPVVAIPRLEAEVSIDGVLDEPAWQQAARLTGFHQYEPVDSRLAEQQTEVLVWYAPDAIHFGIRAFDDQPGSVRATQADRDNIGSDDHVVIYLDTFNDRRRAFFFAVNPLGVQQDGVRTEGATGAGRMFGGDMDESPDFIYQSEGRLTADGYVVEVRIPFKSLRFPGSGEQQWGLQIQRRVQRTGYTDTWTDVRRASASFLVQAGTITGLRDLHRGVVLEAQPFLTATAAGARSSGTQAFEREDVEPSVGANLRVAFTNMVVDATVNPDFSQVESDEGQVTINERFALFFPEKRPFFLEGIELFNTPGQLVYTRRIVDPIAGAKLTGKVGPLAVAHLTAVDENVDGDGREALFNVTRLRADFGSNSQVGVTYTDRTVLDAAAHNRLLAADLRLVFAGLYFFEAQWGGSWTRDPDARELSSALWRAEFDRTGRRWGFNYELSGIGESFRADAGFVNRPGVVSAHGFNRLSLYGRPGALLENATLFFGPSRLWDYARFGTAAAIEGEESVTLNLTVRGGWNGSLNAKRAFWALLPEDYAGLQTADGESYALSNEIVGPSVSLNVSSPTFQRFNASASIGAGRLPIFDEGAEGNGVSTTAELAMRPTDQLRIAFSTSYRVLERARDGSEFARALIPRLKTEFQAARSLFFRAITEYRAERRAELRAAGTGAPLLRDGLPVGPLRNHGIRLDLLASFEPSPGTVAYLGYGSNLSEDPFHRRQFRRDNDGFFLKLAYQFRQ